MIKKMSFAEKTKMRMNLGILIAIAGLLTIGMAIYTTSNMSALNESHYVDFNNGFFTGLGGGLIGAGIMTFIKQRQRLNDPQKFNEAEIRENDERNIYLNQKALSYSAMIWISLLYVGVIVTAFFDSMISMVLVGCGGVALTIYLIVYTMIKKIY